MMYSNHHVGFYNFCVESTCPAVKSRPDAFPWVHLFCFKILFQFLYYASREFSIQLTWIPFKEFNLYQRQKASIMTKRETENNWLLTNNELNNSTGAKECIKTTERVKLGIQPQNVYDATRINEVLIQTRKKIDRAFIL